MLTLLIQDLEHVAVTVEKERAAGLRPPVLDGSIPCYHYTVASYFCFVDICWFFLIMIVLVLGVVAVCTYHVLPC